MLSALALSINVNAQSDYKMMAGAKGGIMGPACTNCGLLYGGGVTFGYAVSQRWVPTIEIGSFMDKDEFGTSVYKTSALVVAVSGDFYPKEAYKGFYISPEFSFINLKTKLDGEIFGTALNNVTAGLNLGWAISFGERIEFVPHLGYSTWFENSKGRITMGTKLGFKF